MLLRLRRGEQKQLIVKSILFAAVWIPLALFVVTSTASVLAQGFVMGAGLHLLYDIGADWKEKDLLRAWLFWPIRRRVSDGELQLVVVVLVGAFGLLSVLLLR